MLKSIDESVCQAGWQHRNTVLQNSKMHFVGSISFVRLRPWRGLKTSFLRILTTGRVELEGNK